MDSFQEKYNALVIKYNALLAENEELKSILSQHGIVYSSIKRAHSCPEKFYHSVSCLGPSPSGTLVVRSV